MTAMRLVHFSDTHLGLTHKHFQKNWDRFSRWLVSEPADLRIHTGDLSVDGADHRDELRHARRILDGLPAAVSCVPGNHDVGHGGQERQSINDARLWNWREEAGPDCWVVDRGAWRLVGLNSLLCGSGHSEEERQRLWLEEIVAQAGNRPLALFSHQPLFIDHPQEGDRGYWTPPPPARDALFRILQNGNLRLVASGHLHIGRVFRRRDVTYCWAPSCAFVVGDLQEEMPGRRDLGAAVLDLKDDGTATAEIVWRDDLERCLIDDVVGDVYPWAVRPAAKQPPSCEA